MAAETASPLPTSLGALPGGVPLAAAATVFAVGLAAILAAWGFQLIGGYLPCKLCLEERIPYYVGLPLAALAGLLAARGGPAWLVRGALAAAALVFAYNAWLGGWHAGVEWGLFTGPSDCGAGAGEIGSVGDLGASLGTIRIVPCDRAIWRFAGLSFAGWNAVISASLALIALVGATVRRRS